MSDSSVQTRDRALLTPSSPYSVVDLRERATEVVGHWLTLLPQGRERYSRELEDGLAWALSAVGQWIERGDAEIHENLAEVFRDLAFAFRSQGFTLSQTLEHLESLEDMMSGDIPPDGDDATPVSLLFRRAMRSLWTETVHLNDALDRRHYRERAEALETFEEIVSHELGNRLGAARTAAELLRESSPALSDERRSELVDLIAEGVDEALKTVDDVSRFIQTQRWDEDVAPLADLIASVTRGIEATARAAGVRLDVEGAIPRASVDAGRMRLVLSNLLVNGIRYADPDEAEPCVSLRVGREDSEVHIEVEDNGVGMSQEDRVAVFRYHRRGENDNHVEGSGLGLTIVKEAVTQMGGRIVVESEPGVGSIFRVIIPQRVGTHG